MSRINLRLLNDKTCHLSNDTENCEFCLCCRFDIAFISLRSVDISVMILNFHHEHFLKCNFWFIVCVYKPLSLNQWQKWLSLTQTHISGIVVKFGLLCRTSVSSWLSWNQTWHLFFNYLLRRVSQIQVNKLLESEKRSYLHQPRLCCC